jgi:hypothetical protein
MLRVRPTSDSAAKVMLTSVMGVLTCWDLLAEESPRLWREGKAYYANVASRLSSANHFGLKLANHRPIQPLLLQSTRQPSATRKRSRGAPDACLANRPYDSKSQIPSTDTSQKDAQVGRAAPVVGSTPGTVLVQLMRT